MNTSAPYTKDDLRCFKPRHATLVGIDSDGCVFPTMDIKQIQCFHPLIVSHWRLQPIERLVRETAEFVNLRSIHRGQNRFVTLLKTFELLRERPEALAAGIPLPETSALQVFVASGVPLDNAELERAASRTGDPELASLLTWSRDVNALVAGTVRNLRPFKEAEASLNVISLHSDALCVSQTPTEALIREWAENGLTDRVSIIAGQELGTKAEHLSLASEGRYAPGRILMIGDAAGDLKAARSVGAHFFPICPGREEESWRRFRLESYSRFLEDRYDPSYEQTLIAEFEALLPVTPPWIRKPVHSAKREGNTV